MGFNGNLVATINFTIIIVIKNKKGSHMNQIFKVILLKITYFNCC